MIKDHEFSQRTELLLGTDFCKHLAKSRVLILGVGGVGGAVAEMVGRYGVGDITLVDGDNVDSSNRNRQLPALSSTLGASKVDVVASRLKDINPNIKVTPIKKYIADNNDIEELLSLGFDCVVDAIDSLGPKVFFIAKCVELKIPIISSMGSGGRRAPEQVSQVDISKSHGCALARSVRGRLSKLGIRKGVQVVFSPEPVPKSAIKSSEDKNGNYRSTVGTVSYMPNIFGCHISAGVLKELEQQYKGNTK